MKKRVYGLVLILLLIASLVYFGSSMLSSEGTKVNLPKKSFNSFEWPGKSSNSYGATDCNQVTEISRIECEALLAVYRSTNGDYWRNNEGWNKTNSPCYWKGVICKYNGVVDLDLTMNGLIGFIPPELGNLVNLTALVLFANQLTGSIPPELGNLRKLKHLDLGANYLKRSIPPELGNLLSLEVLYLSSNRLNGLISFELSKLESLKYLKHLDLSINRFNGSLPSKLGNFVNLEHLMLHNNELCGDIPKGLMLLNKIHFISLENNKLRIPTDSELIKFLDDKSHDELLLESQLGFGNNWRNQSSSMGSCPSN